MKEPTTPVPAHNDTKVRISPKMYAMGLALCATHGRILSFRNGGACKQCGVSVRFADAPAPTRLCKKKLHPIPDGAARCADCASKGARERRLRQQGTSEATPPNTESTASEMDTSDVQQSLPDAEA